jgi:hypothetical protein
VRRAGRGLRRILLILGDETLRVRRKQQNQCKQERHGWPRNVQAGEF